MLHLIVMCDISCWSLLQMLDSRRSEIQTHSVFISGLMCLMSILLLRKFISANGVKITIIQLLMVHIVWLRTVTGCALLLKPGLSICFLPFAGRSLAFHPFPGHTHGLRSTVGAD